MLEGLSCGVPIIVTQVEEAKYLIKHKIDGILSSDTSFTFWINKLLNKYTLYNKLKSNSRNLIVKHFDWNKNSWKLSKLFEKCNIINKQILIK